ncbi:TonB-dependent siderophore receptor [Thauera sp. Sel9]|uniref:TonB-dependent siderophore receptor n=1 Tax=Thauera sp. Sel9 TaxID=2974299 RepID=UPI0021E1843A|nr:TonB-dependent receptor [Thauera sp. Sel9]MCV2216316.1 TonB-dependent receptor [Thauera sp. Sel9]
MFKPSSPLPPNRRRQALALAVRAALLGLPLLIGLPQVRTAAHAAETIARQSYEVPSGPLAGALLQFARQAGIQLSVDASLTAGHGSKGLRGQYSIDSALSALLAGTKLEAVNRGGNEYTLRKLPVRQGETTLAPVAVTASVERSAISEGTGSYGARGASIMKGVQSLKETPQSVTVITRQRMDDQGLDTLENVLANTTGVTLRRRVGGGNDIVIRGFETNTIQYDGMPLPRSYTNGNMLQASSVHLDRVEVLRGAQGLLEGAGSPAGAVNLVRKRGTAERRLTVEGRAGSWDNYGARVDAGGPLNEAGTLRARAVLDYEDKSAYVDKVWDRNLSAYAALDLDATPDTTLGLGLAHTRFKGNSGIYNGLPRHADGTMPDISRRANMDADWSEATREETQLFVDFEHRFNPDWKLKASGIYIDETFDGATALSYFRLIPVGGNSMTAPGFAYDFGGRSKGLDINLSGAFQALGIAHEIVVGGSYSNQERDDAFHEYSNTTIDIFDSKADIIPLGARALSRMRDLGSKTTQRGLYGLWRGHLTDRATLILGGRTSWYDYRSAIVNPVNGAIVTRSREKESGEFTPYGGLVYALTPQWSAYASYAEIFEPQSVTDAGFKVLPPMTGVNYELGIKGELFDGALNTSLAVFRVDQKNRAVTDYDSPMLCGGWYCSRAAGKVRSQGVELEAHGTLARGWQLSGGYTYNRNKYLEDADESLVGKPFSDETPRHMLRLWSDYQLAGELEKWRIGAGVNYRSKQKTDSATMKNPVQGGYAVWNARVAYQIDKTWSAALNVENLFDKRYYSNITANYLHSYVGEPRSFLLTVRGSF